MAHRLIAISQHISAQQPIFYDQALAAKMIQLCVDSYVIGKKNSKLIPQFYPGFKHLTNIHNDKLLQQSSSLAFIGVDDALKSIIVCVRGTDNLTNTIDDLIISFSKFTTKKGKQYNIHQGFNVNYQILEDKNLSVTVDNLVKKYPGYAVIYTGHSLGGAVATIAALKHKDRTPNLNIKIYTCGQPRIGDQEFAEFSDKLIEQNFRVVNKEDRVPHIPKIKYYHTGFQIWYKNGTQKQFGMFKPESKNGAKSTSIFFREVQDHSSEDYNLLKKKKLFKKEDVKNAQK